MKYLQNTIILLLTITCSNMSFANENGKVLLEDQDWKTVFIDNGSGRALVSFTGSAQTTLGASCEFDGNAYQHIHYIFPRYKPQIYKGANGLDFVDIYLKAGPTEFSTSMLAGKTASGADRLYYPTFSANSSIIQRLIEARDLQVSYKMANGKVHTEKYSLMGYTNNVTQNVEACQQLSDEVTKSNLANTPENATPASSNQPEMTSIGTGTCFAVSSDGHLVTNDHVIRGAKSVLIHLPDNTSHEAEVVKSSPSIDLAVLKIATQTPDYLDLASSRQVNKGDKVFTIGFPVTDILGVEAKYTEGSISSMSGLKNEPIAYQITVPIQPGNSGGPLVNDEGQVVGVITSSAAAMQFFDYSGSLPQNINWAVKSDYLMPLLELNIMPRSSKTKSQAMQAVENSVCLVETRY